MYLLSYNGNKALTRCSVPLSLRKEGLWITYVLYDHTVITEWYNSDNIDDESFGSDDNWRSYISAGVVQETGNNTAQVMSQDAVTRELNKLFSKVEDKQEQLVSGENIKTINGQSVLGYGDITIQGGGGGGGSIDPELLEGFIPLSRDFSDDFNNDFAR